LLCTQAEKEALEAEVSRCEEAVREAEGAVQRQRAETAVLTAGIAGAEKVGAAQQHSLVSTLQALRRRYDTTFPSVRIASSVAPGGTVPLLAKSTTSTWMLSCKHSV
jgi:septal ring factor EnvC (AmiA/AmiB activator)